VYLLVQYFIFLFKKFVIGQVFGKKKGVTWDLRIWGSLVLVLLNGIKRPNLLTFLERLYQIFREAEPKF